MTEPDIIRGLVAEIDATAAQFPEVGEASRDWACKECVGEPTVGDGNFICAYHQARAYLRKHGSKH